MLTLFERGVVAHLVADWLLQNDWMARNKTNLRHPAGWVHSAIHVVLLGLALGWQAGLVLGLVHMVIDTRQVMKRWQRFYRQTMDGPNAIHVAIWADQVLHIAVIAAWVQFVRV
ncbi:MAG TPA: DUF3307 domain-containing protein [Anaerolineae bacterium]